MHHAIRLGILQALLALGFLCGTAGGSPSAAGAPEARHVRAAGVTIGAPVLAQHMPPEEASDSRLTHWSDGDDGAPAPRAGAVAAAPWTQTVRCPAARADAGLPTHPACASPPRAPPRT